MLLFTLFWAQFIVGAIVPEARRRLERNLVSITYLLLGVATFPRQRRLVVPLLRDGFRTPYARFGEPSEA